MIRLRPAFLLLAAPSCVAAIGGDLGDVGDDGPSCEEIGAPGPDAPTLLQPEQTKPVTDAALRIESAASGDLGGGDRDAAHAEIWLMAGDELVERVWSATDDAPGTSIVFSLADGEFDSGFDGLTPWARYGVRVRHRSPAACWGEWSEVRAFRSDDGSAEIFSDTIQRVELEIPSASWSAIDAEAVPADCSNFDRSYYAGTVTLDGERFSGAGIRVKGGCGSSRDLDGKPGFKAHLSWDDPVVPGCPEERRYRGLKRLTLNNQVQDPSFVHERIGYRFYQLLGIVVPRTVPTEVYVNGELFGLYLHVETIDRRMLARNFESHRGMLYEGNHSCDLRSDKMPSGEVDGCFEKKFTADACSEIEPGDDPMSFEPLRALTAAVEAIPAGGFYPAIEELVDFDAYLSLWAADTILNHWDGHLFNVPHNYRIYHDPATDRWSFISTGIDQVLAPAYQSHLDVDAWNVAAVLAQRCLAEPACEAAFAARLIEALAIFDGADFAARAREIEAQVAPQVAVDPRLEVSFADFHSAVDQTVQYMAARPAAVRAMLAERGY